MAAIAFGMKVTVREQKWVVVQFGIGYRGDLIFCLAVKEEESESEAPVVHLIRITKEEILA